MSQQAVPSVNISLPSSERHLDPGKPSTKEKLSILGSLGDSSSSVGSEALSSAAPNLVLHLIPLIHVTANAMSKGTALAILMTKYWKQIVLGEFVPRITRVINWKTKFRVLFQSVLFTNFLLKHHKNTHFGVL